MDALRRRLSLTETPLPDEIKDTHLRVFGKVLSPLEAVRRILAEVKEKGDEAVLSYMNAFDGISIPSERLRVSEEEIKRSYRQVSPSFRKALRKTRKNIDRKSVV